MNYAFLNDRILTIFFKVKSNLVCENHGIVVSEVTFDLLIRFALLRVACTLDYIDY